MEYSKGDEEIVRILRKESSEFREEEQNHEKLSKRLEKLNKRKNLLPEEEISAKKLHLEKLAVKDSLMNRIRQFRSDKIKS
jgi:uncharacterized protein YdcH (DUF465 family)